MALTIPLAVVLHYTCY